MARLLGLLAVLLAVISYQVRAGGWLVGFSLGPLLLASVVVLGCLVTRGALGRADGRANETNFRGKSS